ncbi:MAG TPA: ABC transporter substrate-binding protein [Stellaceae bacterium]|nr:ABC transporter substrate-binding protein [Stellaceae bacterium]
MISRRRFLATTTASTALLAARVFPAFAANAPGVTDKEIKIGQTMPYSGPASSYGAIGKAELAYFKKINDEGGISGRMLNLLSLDDGYSPPKTVEQIRRLVEQDQVAFIFQSLGTPSNSAIQKYLNDHKVPQLFVATGATKWNDPKNFPWTIGWQPNYQTEGHIYAKYLLTNKPDAKVGILYQNDDYGKDYVKGLKDGLGDKAAGMVVKEESYETSDPTVDSQIVSLQASGADTFLNATTPKFAAQAIRKAFDIGWKPLHFLNNVSISVGTVLKPAGLEKSVGVITADYRKDSSDPRWDNDAGKKQWLAFMQKYMPDADLGDNDYPYGMMAAMTMVQVLKQAGNDLSRENIMKEAANLKDLELPMLLPGIKLNTSPDNFAPIKQMQLQRFNGKSWELFGDVLSG